MFTTITGEQSTVMSDIEIKAKNAADRKAYLKTLRDLCPSNDMRQEAKRISKRQDSCASCVYCDGESAICWCPHSDLRMKDLNIDPCYEGVLKWFVRRAQDDALYYRQDPERQNIDLLITLTGYILDWVDNGKKPSQSELNSIRELHYVAKNTSWCYKKLKSDG